MESTDKDSQYLENLRAILDGVQAEYQQTINWRNTQFAHLRNYMWAAATLFAFESSLVLGIAFPGKGLPLPWDIESILLFRFLATAAIGTCALAFLFALDACRARGGIEPPCNRPWTSLAEIAHDEKEGTQTAGTTLVTMITALEKACRKHRKQNGEKAQKLRWISHILWISSGFTVLFIMPW